MGCCIMDERGQHCDCRPCGLCVDEDAVLRPSSIAHVVSRLGVLFGERGIRYQGKAAGRGGRGGLPGDGVATPEGGG